MVAVAGGVVLSEANRELLMRSGVVVWLRASIETLSGRVRTRGSATPSRRDAAQSLRELYRDRHPLYAWWRVRDDVDDLAPEEVVARLLAETGLVADQ